MLQLERQNDIMDLLRSKHEMTVKELCERAKINKKTFYRYYPAMEDLLLELQMESMIF